MIATLRATAAIAPERSSAPNALVTIRDPAPEFDPGPLSWVQREIDQALAQGLESLAAFNKPERDAAALKTARMHMHLAAGAIRMVGLDAVAEFASEIERVIAALEGADGAKVQATCAMVERACRKLSIFLGELASGAPPAVLKLYPEYEALQRSRGIGAVTPSDLFYPDLRIRAPKVVLREAIPENKRSSHLAKKRRLYQSGLLLWLRGEAAGARQMREAVAGIEAVTTQENLRAFWWTVRALLEAIGEHGLRDRPELKQLAARIDLQIRRVLEGSGMVADRLRREVLYYVAISAPVAPRVRAVQRAFRLGRLIPAPDTIDADFAQIEPRLREGRERLASIKETWLNFAAGRTENLTKLKQALSVVHAQATELRHAALTELTAALLERLNSMAASAPPEALAMEFTTGLLLAESAFENYANLSAEFPQQVQAMLARLEAAGSGRVVPGDATMLGNLGKRAQERMILSQVGYEIRANLHHMEEVLDEFFRDEAKRPTLASLAKDSRQIHGALRILGLDDADRLLTQCDDRIQAYATPEARVGDDELDLLAESLCGLEFYFEAVEQQRRDAHRLIAPLLARWLGEAPPQPVEEDESVEHAVAALRAELPRLVEAARSENNDQQARTELKTKLVQLRDDAELIGDEELALRAGVAIAELEHGRDLGAAVQAVVPADQTPEISEETKSLLDKDATGRDAGLLDIYLAEATKVLVSVGEALSALVRNPDDRHALDTVRLGFHTLKESGRMVGLTALGDLAAEIEAVHTRLLEKERCATATVVAMIDTAQASFGDWVEALRQSGKVDPDPLKLRAALRVVEDELAPQSKGIVDVAMSVSRGPEPLISIPVPPVLATVPRTPTANTRATVTTAPMAPISIPVPSVATEKANIVEVPRTEGARPAAKKDIWSVALLQPTSSETLSGVHDEIDADLLARFLEEAGRLLPAAREELRAWRRAPSEYAASEALRRSLHAFKGGARMAGAMRLGHLLQSMESRLVTCEHRAPPPELFQALDTDLDFIGFMLEQLKADEPGSALPRLAPASPAKTKAAAQPVVPPKARAVERPIVVPVALEPAINIPIPLPEPSIGHSALAEPVAVSGGTIESLKADLAAMAQRMKDLSAQLREIEVQTELSMRSRMTELHESGGECDSGELESLTRVQDLAAALCATLTDLTAVRQSLLRHIDDADAALSERGLPPGT